MSAIRSWDRLEPMAWRSWSASPGVKLATSMAICMSCSWNSGTPRVFFRHAFEQRVEVGDRLLAPRGGGCRGGRSRPGSGPGRMSATSMTMS